MVFDPRCSCQCLAMDFADSGPGQTWLHVWTSDVLHCGELVWGSLDSWLMRLPASDLLCISCSCLKSCHPTCHDADLSSGLTFPNGPAQPCCSLTSCLLLLSMVFVCFVLIWSILLKQTNKNNKPKQKTKQT